VELKGLSNNEIVEEKKSLTSVAAAAEDGERQETDVEDDDVDRLAVTLTQL